jgi:prolyl oligopeptidase
LFFIVIKDAQRSSGDASMTRKCDHVDLYHGIEVPDPYRWLEDDTSAETAAWVQAQNAITFPYLERIPFRAELQARVLQLNDYEK